MYAHFKFGCTSAKLRNSDPITFVQALGAYLTNDQYNTHIYECFDTNNHIALKSSLNHIRIKWEDHPNPTILTERRWENLEKYRIDIIIGTTVNEKVIGLVVAAISEIELNPFPNPTKKKQSWRKIIKHLDAEPTPTEPTPTEPTPTEPTPTEPTPTEPTEPTPTEPTGFWYRLGVSWLLAN